MGKITVDTRNRKPIYEQLVDNIRQSVLRGELLPGEQLPSVRSLAGELAINPNTIQKAYAELEHRGVICSLPGRGSFISEDIAGLTDSNRERIVSELTSKLAEARDAGVSRCDAECLVKTVWEETT